MTTTLYIAGSARGKAGGWTYTLKSPDRAEHIETGSTWNATSPRMELLALVKGLEAVPSGALEVVLSSEALLRTATEWMPGWRANGWKKKSGSIRNLDLVQQLATHIDRLHITWTLSEGKIEPLDAARKRAREAVAEADPPKTVGPAPVTGTVGPSEKRLVAYTDGGCRGNPGIGGWGFLLIDTRSGAALSRRGGEAETTNNRMEMMAAIEAMSALSRPDQQLEIRTDSRYLCDVATTWMQNWKRRDWKRKTGEPVKNVDLVQRIDALQNQHQVTWTWVRGHAGEPGNEFADHLTNAAMDDVSGGRTGTDEQRYPASPITVHPR